jgi:hypothetical protein
MVARRARHARAAAEFTSQIHRMAVIHEMAEHAWIQQVKPQRSGIRASITPDTSFGSSGVHRIVSTTVHFAAQFNVSARVQQQTCGYWGCWLPLQPFA